jgi:hypothetical protein
MRRLAVGLVIGSLVLGGMALPAEAGHGHRGYHKYHHQGHGGGYFAGGFLAGAGTVLVLNAFLTPRVVYGPPVVYAAPVVYQPVYYRAPVCQDVWVQERWELRPQQQNGFTTYYQVLVPGYWQRYCS